MLKVYLLMCEVLICLYSTISFTITELKYGGKCSEDTNTCYSCMQLIFVYLLLSKPKIKHDIQLTHLNHSKRENRHTMTVIFSMESRAVKKSTGRFMPLGNLKIKQPFCILLLSLCTVPVKAEGCSPSSSS